jgi:hypothetical protein
VTGEDDSTQARRLGAASRNQKNGTTDFTDFTDKKDDSTQAQSRHGATKILALAIS